jgi:hypothetical protein
MLDEAKRQRPMPAAIKARREALSIIQPFQQKIHGWQLQTAQLAGLSSRTQGDGSQRPRYLDEAYALSHAVDAARASLRRQIIDLSPAIAKSSSTIDTMRALDSVVAVLDEVIGQLEIPIDVLRTQANNVQDHLGAPPRA